MKEFEKLPLEEQVNIIVRDGILLETGQSTIYRSDVYALGRNFVEVLLFPTTLNFIHIRKATDKRLQRLLDRVTYQLEVL